MNFENFIKIQYLDFVVNLIIAVITKIIIIQGCVDYDFIMIKFIKHFFIAINYFPFEEIIDLNLHLIIIKTVINSNFILNSNFIMNFKFFIITITAINCQENHKIN